MQVGEPADPGPVHDALLRAYAEGPGLPWPTPCDRSLPPRAAGGPGARHLLVVPAASGPAESGRAPTAVAYKALSDQGRGIDEGSAVTTLLSASLLHSLHRAGIAMAGALVYLVDDSRPSRE
jgi:hypothetical protein